MKFQFGELARGLAIPLLTLACAGAMAAESVEGAGQKTFELYCAGCHNKDAKGGGPFATMMTKQPADLTVLAKNNGGVFPFDKVYQSIDARTLPVAHGGRDMPIWGRDWEGGSGAGAETAARGRILEVMMYLRSIQMK